MVLFTLAGLALDLGYKVLGFVASGASRLVFGKPKTEQQLDTVLARLEEQQKELDLLLAVVNRPPDGTEVVNHTEKPKLL